MARNRRHSSSKSSTSWEHGAYWLYGTHAVQTALDNRRREVLRAVMTRNAASRIRLRDGVEAEVVDPAQIERLVPAGAVHQGVALQVRPLGGGDWQSIADAKQPIVLLDQATDPHNVGAILRSAAAFGLGAVLVTKDHAPPETGVLAKSACGALDVVPLIRVGNLVQEMKALKDAGYWLVGLDGQADGSIAKIVDYQPVCLVMGAEGKGLRRLTAEACDALLSIPIQSQMESLNVSNAAAIAMYALRAEAR